MIISGRLTADYNYRSTGADRERAERRRSEDGDRQGIGECKYLPPPESRRFLVEPFALPTVPCANAVMHAHMHMPSSDLEAAAGASRSPPVRRRIFRQLAFGIISAVAVAAGLAIALGHRSSGTRLCCPHACPSQRFLVRAHLLARAAAVSPQLGVAVVTCPMSCYL